MEEQGNTIILDEKRADELAREFVESGGKVEDIITKAEIDVMGTIEALEPIPADDDRPAFAYELGWQVELLSGEQGYIIGRAEYAEAADGYLIRYKSADGCLVESWWTEFAILEARPPKE